MNPAGRSAGGQNTGEPRSCVREAVQEATTPKKQLNIQCGPLRSPEKEPPRRTACDSPCGIVSALPSCCVIVGAVVVTRPSPVFFVARLAEFCVMRMRLVIEGAIAGRD